MAKNSKLPALDRSVTLESLSEFSGKLDRLTTELREQLVAPQPRKSSPVFSSSQVAGMCGIDRAKLNYLVAKGELPSGEMKGTGRSRVFSLAEAREWVRASTRFAGRPNNARASTLCVSNLKGGSTKTTTSMCLAQGLNLLGRKVLLIDLDPQASLTELCGVYAEKDVTENDTVLPFIENPTTEKLESVIQSTYWDGLDVIPAHPSLFSAEFHLPAMLIKDKTFPFFDLVRQGIEPLKDRYDYIIIDTAPSLSYLTINALMAGDALVMPVAPESLDFMSLISFWKLFSDVANSIQDHWEIQKTYDFISVLLTKVDYSAASSSSVARSWMSKIIKN